MPDFGEGYSEDGFQRQRRNLIVGTAALLLVNVAEIQIGTGGNALGVTFTIGKPYVLRWALFVAVLYWALRFYQYHRARRTVDLQTAARERMWHFLQARALDYIVPERPRLEAPVLPDGCTINLIIRDFGITDYQREAIYARVKLGWQIYTPGEEHPQVKDLNEYDAIFKGWLIWKARALGYVQASVNTPAFTDCIFPYLLFFGTIAFALYRELLK